jgi:hypothetical protein
MFYYSCAENKYLTNYQFPAIDASILIPVPFGKKKESIAVQAYNNRHNVGRSLMTLLLLP